MQEVMQCLKKYGQRLDLEIAAEMRVPLATVRKLLAELAAAGEVVMCERVGAHLGMTATHAGFAASIPAPSKMQQTDLGPEHGTRLLLGVLDMGRRCGPSESAPQELRMATC